MTARVTVVGSLNMDLVIRAPRIPRPGETLIGSAFRTVPGGKGANQAVAAARLGADVSLVGRVGRDAFGEALLAEAAGATHVPAFGVAPVDTTAAGDASGGGFAVALA
jgi:ribokinase